MKPARIAEMIREFPFLSRLITPADVKIIRVQRMSEELLNARPSTTAYGDEGGGETDYYFILDKLGVLIKRAKRSRWTLGDRFSRLDHAQIGYVVRIESDGGHDGDTVTVYKPAKTGTIQEWMEKRARRQTASERLVR